MTHIWETYGKHLRDNRETSERSGERTGRHLGDTWETSVRHLGDIWETSGRYLADIWEISGRRLGDI